MGNAAVASKPLATNSNDCDPCYILYKKTVGSSYICRDCRHQLCDDCFIHHQKVVSTRNHTVLPLPHKDATQFQVSGRQDGSSNIDAALQVSGSILGSTDNVSTLQVSGRKPHFTETGSGLQVSGRKAGYDSQTPVSQVSGRRAGPTHKTAMVQQKGTKSMTKAQINTKPCGTAALEVDGRRVQNEDQVTGSDSVGQDQAVSSSMKNMRLDGGTSTTQTTRQTGKPYTSVTLEHSLNVKRENDRCFCHITGLVVLQDKLIVCDRLNSKLKVYDSSYRFLYEYKCDYLLWDIAMLDVNTVVVSSISGRNMRLLSVGNDSMKEISKINTEYECRGVCCYEGNIYCVVWCYKDYSEYFSEVRVYTTSGHLEHKFEHLSDGRVECKHLKYITVNPQTVILYVTDWYTGVVLALSTSGDVITVMSPPQLGGPVGIAVDNNGRIYVCGWGSGNVIEMSPDGGHIVEILSCEDKCKYPICVKIYGNKMFVSHCNTGSNNYKVSIYQLS